MQHRPPFRHRLNAQNCRRAAGRLNSGGLRVKWCCLGTRDLRQYIAQSHRPPDMQRSAGRPIPVYHRSRRAFGFRCNPDQSTYLSALIRPDPDGLGRGNIRMGGNCGTSAAAVIRPAVIKTGEPIAPNHSVTQPHSTMWATVLPCARDAVCATPKGDVICLDDCANGCFGQNRICHRRRKPAGKRAIVMHVSPFLFAKSIGSNRDCVKIAEQIELTVQHLERRKGAVAHCKTV